MLKKNKIKVLICDDSALIRLTFKKIIESDQELSVIGIAKNGEEVIEKSLILRPDVITLDVNMPIMDGLSALKIIIEKKIAPVIMISSLTEEGAQESLEAIELGAFDFIAKPTGHKDISQISKEILNKIKGAAKSNIYKSQISSLTSNKNDKKPEINKIINSNLPGGNLGFKIITLGISTGGPKSIFNVLPNLPGDLKAPIIVVQHMPPSFVKTFAERINKRTALDCIETEAGMRILPGKIYIAKGGFHLKIIKKYNNDIIIRQTKSPDHLFMPSVDIMMDSISDIFKADTIGVLMTGMGSDGALGIENIAKLGGYTIAESKETSVVFGMPQAAIKTGYVKKILPNNAIANEIIKVVNGRLS